MAAPKKKAAKRTARPRSTSSIPPPPDKMPDPPAHPVLDPGASGLRHLRWGREVVGTLRGFLVPSNLLVAEERLAIEAEAARISALVTALSQTVKPYRDFLERTRTLTRGKLRAARFLTKSNTGFRISPSAHQSKAWLAEIEGEMKAVIEPERERLSADLAFAIAMLRSGLHSMDERLGALISPEFVAALYPPVTQDGSRVLDDGDPDDDASGA